MKTTTNTARPALTPAQIADRARLIEQVRRILSAQFRGDIKGAQGDYEWLMGWCEGKGVDFASNYAGAVRHLQKTACGVLDSAAYAAA